MDISLLSQLSEVPGAPGFEEPIRALVLKELEGLADEIFVDNMGNIHALKKGADSSKTVMSAAHIDEIGFIVTHIDDKGFVRFHPLGGHDAKTLTSQRVIIHGKKDLLGVMGCKPIHIMSPEERNKIVPISDYFIDLGLSKKEVEAVVSVGDPITRQRELVELGHCVNAKSLDNRVSVFVLLETLRKLAKSKKKPAFDFMAVFTVQEEVGLRGAHASTMKVCPDFAICLDTTIAFDVPGSTPKDQVTALGEGVAIKVLDGGTICDSRMVSFLKKVADNQKIKWQPEILPAGGTDTAAMQKFVPGGSIAGALSIPTRHIHQVIEMAHKEDIQRAIDLLAAAVVEIDCFDWEFPSVSKSKICAKTNPAQKKIKPENSPKSSAKKR